MLITVALSLLVLILVLGLCIIIKNFILDLVRDIKKKFLDYLYEVIEYRLSQPKDQLKRLQEHHNLLVNDLGYEWKYKSHNRGGYVKIKEKK